MKSIASLLIGLSFLAAVGSESFLQLWNQQGPSHLDAPPLPEDPMTMLESVPPANFEGPNFFDGSADVSLGHPWSLPAAPPRQKSFSFRDLTQRLFRMPKGLGVGLGVKLPIFGKKAPARAKPLVLPPELMQLEQTMHPEALQGVSPGIPPLMGGAGPHTPLNFFGKPQRAPPVEDFSFAASSPTFFMSDESFSPPEFSVQDLRQPVFLTTAPPIIVPRQTKRRKFLPNTWQPIRARLVQKNRIGAGPMGRAVLRPYALRKQFGPKVTDKAESVQNKTFVGPPQNFVTTAAPSTIAPSKEAPTAAASAPLGEAVINKLDSATLSKIQAFVKSLQLTGGFGDRVFTPKPQTTKPPQIFFEKPTAPSNLGVIIEVAPHVQNTTLEEGAAVESAAESEIVESVVPTESDMLRVTVLPTGAVTTVGDTESVSEATAKKELETELHNIAKEITEAVEFDNEIGDHSDGVKTTQEHVVMATTTPTEGSTPAEGTTGFWDDVSLGQTPKVDVTLAHEMTSEGLTVVPLTSAATTYQPSTNIDIPSGVVESRVSREAAAAFPTLSNRAASNFTCDGRAAGFYADIELGCQVYHHCGGGGYHQRFMCPNGTLYSELTQNCDFWFNIDCRFHARQNQKNNEFWATEKPSESPDVVLKLNSQVQQQNMIEKSIEPKEAFGTRIGFIEMPIKNESNN